MYSDAEAKQAAPPCFIGLDLGTSGVRAIAADLDGEALLELTAPLPPPASQPHGISQDPGIWREAAFGLLRRLDAELADHRPAALAIDGTSGTLLAADASGAPLGPALMYNDCRSAAIGARIDQHAPHDSPTRGPCSTAARALELLRRYPRARYLLHQADWLLGQLLGEYCHSDHNNALKLGYDPVAGCWPAWLDAAGIPRDRLPRPLAPGTPLGRISPHLAKACRLPPRLLLVAGSTDSTAAIMATGATAPGEGITALGTTLVVKIICDHPISAPRYGVYSQPFAGRWLVGGSSNSGGGVLARYFTSGQLASLSERIDPARPSGLDYYPLNTPGERFPINDPDWRPRLAPRPDEDRLFLQGLLEGIARIEKQGYERLRQLGAPTLVNVRTTGGGAINPGWRQIRQRLLGVPLVDTAHHQAAMGMALQARRGYIATGANRPKP